MKLQAFELPDSDKRARNKTDLKIGSEIESEKNNGLNPIKRKTTNGLNNGRSFTEPIQRTRSLKRTVR